MAYNPNKAPKVGDRVNLFTYIGEENEPGARQLAPYIGTVAAFGQRLVNSRVAKTYKVDLDTGRRVEGYYRHIQKI